MILSNFHDLNNAEDASLTSRYREIYVRLFPHTLHLLTIRIRVTSYIFYFFISIHCIYKILFHEWHFLSLSLSLSVAKRDLHNILMLLS